MRKELNLEHPTCVTPTTDCSSQSDSEDGTPDEGGILLDGVPTEQSEGDFIAVDGLYYTLCSANGPYYTCEF